jgi:hypothetical protein
MLAIWNRLSLQETKKSKCPKNKKKMNPCQTLNGLNLSQEAIIALGEDNIGTEAVEFRPNSGFAKSIDDWIKYLPIGTVFIEIWMLSKKYLDAHNYCERRSEKWKRMNIAYFHKMTQMEALSSFFQK